MAATVEGPRTAAARQAARPVVERRAAKARRLLDADKAGHGGTLDPLADGLLPVMFGEACKLAESALEGDKAYEATVRLGQVTTTDDTEGEVVERRAGRCSRDAQLEAALARFRGPIVQVPPVYSALKVAGKAALPLRPRRRPVQAAPRPVTIHESQLLAPVDGDEPSLSIGSPAARAPMSARWRATSAPRSAAAPTSSPCAAPTSGRFRRGRGASRWTSSAADAAGASDAAAGRPRAAGGRLAAVTCTDQPRRPASARARPVVDLPPADRSPVRDQLLAAAPADGRRRPRAGAEDRRSLRRPTDRARPRRAVTTESTLRAGHRRASSCHDITTRRSQSDLRTRRLDQAARSATSPSSPTSTTARPRWSTSCCASPARSAPTRRSTSG